MRRILTIITLALSLAALSAGESYAQEYTQAPVTISKEKIKNNGKVYYSHVVLERQTLFSISKAYSVSVEDIYAANPTLNLEKEGLKKNEIILIPVKDEQTQADSAKSSPQNKDDFFYHTAKWFEDLDAIASKYGTTADVLMAFNGMKNKNISKKQKIKIPRNPQNLDLPTATVKPEPEKQIEPDPQPETVTAPEADKNIEENSGLQIPSWGSLFGGAKKEDISATLMLPFNAQGHVSENDMDFYAGALLAVREHAEKGINIDLNVFDVATSMPVTKERLTESDIIIGPTANNDITKALTLTPAEKMIVSPLNLKGETLARENGQVIQKPTPLESQYADVIQWVKEDMRSGDRMIVITEKGAKASTMTTVMNSALQSSGLEYSSLSYGILEGRNIDNNLSSMMNIDAVNRVVIISESEAFVNDAVRNLSLLTFKKYNVVLYSPAKIRSFDTIDVEDFHKVKMHVSMSYYVDYNDSKVIDFLHKYRALFNTEPSPYAFQGYDTADYFIRICNKYGDNWYSALTRESASGLQANFKFVETDANGYVNEGVRRIVYNEDYSISLSE